MPNNEFAISGGQTLNRKPCTEGGKRIREVTEVPNKPILMAQASGVSENRATYFGVSQNTDYGILGYTLFWEILIQEPNKPTFSDSSKCEGKWLPRAERTDFVCFKA